MITCDYLNTPDIGDISHALGALIRRHCDNVGATQSVVTGESIVAVLTWAPQKINGNGI